MWNGSFFLTEAITGGPRVYGKGKDQERRRIRVLQLAISDSCVSYEAMHA